MVAISAGPVLSELLLSGWRDKLLGLPLSSSQGFTLALPCRKLLQNPGLPTGSPAD